MSYYNLRELIIKYIYKICSLDKCSLRKSIGDFKIRVATLFGAILLHPSSPPPKSRGAKVLAIGKR